MALTQIKGSNIEDGTVVAADVADNAVTGAKIAMGSDAAGDILTYNGTDYIRLAKGTAEQVLKMNSGATAVEWGTDAGGIAIPGSSVAGDTLYHNGSIYTRLAKGTAAQVLTMNAGATAPEWAAAAGGVDGITSAANATAISIDSTERVTMPLQPSFSAYLTSNANGVVGGATTYHITNAFTEHFDIGGNFNAANGTFTAPVTGKYILATWIHVGGIDTAHSYYEAMFTTSNFQYRFDHNELDSGFAGTWYAKGTIVADMDASDTAYLTYRLSGSSTGTANVAGGTTGVWFSGMLIG
jgi:hypothetical protein